MSQECSKENIRAIVLRRMKEKVEYKINPKKEREHNIKSSLGNEHGQILLFFYLNGKITKTWTVMDLILQITECQTFIELPKIGSCSIEHSTCMAHQAPLAQQPSFQGGIPSYIMADGCQLVVGCSVKGASGSHAACWLPGTFNCYRILP